MRARLFPWRIKQLELFDEGALAAAAEALKPPPTQALLGHGSREHPLVDFGKWFDRLDDEGVSNWFKYKHSELHGCLSGNSQEDPYLLFLCRQNPVDIRWANIVKPHMEEVYHQKIDVVTIAEGETWESLKPRLAASKRAPRDGMMKDFPEFWQSNRDIIWLEPCVRDLDGVTQLALTLCGDKKWLSRIISVTTIPGMRSWLTHEEKFGFFSSDEFERKKLSFRTGMISILPTPAEDAETLSEKRKQVLELPPMSDKHQPLFWEAAKEVRKRKRRGEPEREPLLQIL